jgi:hypothetical protein
MSRRKKHRVKRAALQAAKIEAENKRLIQEALEKYKELYSFSTDILLKELERFSSADEKASKHATMFFFLIGAVAYFDKWIFDRLKWPDFPTGLPPDWPLVVVGLAALIASAFGLWLSSLAALRLRPVLSRPLNQQILDFFENESRITIYYGLARENSKAYEENRKATEGKFALLQWSNYLMLLVFTLLAELVVMYCLYSWC